MYRMKQTAMFLVAIMFLNIMPWVTAFADGQEFSDVPQEHIAYEAISYFKKSGVLNGVSKMEFFPDVPVKREEFAKIASLAFKLPNSEEKELGLVFSDVEKGQWYVPYIDAVLHSKLMQGMSESSFGIGNLVTRQDLATVMYRLADYENISLTNILSNQILDDAFLADYARNASDAIVGSGIMLLSGDGYFRPNDFATRAEVADAMYRLRKIRIQNAEDKGRNATMEERLDGPYDVPVDDRLAKSMPNVFDLEKYPKREILKEDFNDDDFGLLEPVAESIADGVSFDKENGIAGSGCLKLDATQDKVLFPRFRLRLYGAQPGEHYTFSVMIKGENIVKGEKSSSGYKGIIQYYDQNGKWLTETSKPRLSQNTDWILQEYTLAIPIAYNLTEDVEFYDIYLCAHTIGMSGTMYFDDMTLSKVSLEPMDTVLMKPNYKGLIYGEGGVDDIAIRTYIHDYNGGYDMTKMHHTAQITDKDGNVILKTESDTVTNVMDTHFSSESLTMGADYWVEVILKDKESGKQLSKREWCIRKREENYRPKIYIDEYNRIVKDGKPTIPLAAFNHGGYERVSDLYLNTPLTTFGDFATEIAFHNTEQYQKIEKEIADSGMDFITELAGIWWSAPTSSIWKTRMYEQKDVRGFITRQVNDMKDLPWTGYYYIHDEINPILLSQEIAWNNEIVASLDLDHPTISAVDNNFPALPGIFAQGSDILGGDPYPVTGKDSQDISRVYKHLAETKAMNPGRPIYLISQGFWFENRGDLRGPTEQEYRNMIFQGLSAGAVMFNMYSLRELIRRGSAPGKTTEESWAEYMKVHSEIKEMEPIILSREIAPYYEISGNGESVYSFSSRHEGKSYLFVVSVEKQPKTVDFYLDGVKTVKGKYSGKSYEADSSGWFHVDFETYGTEVFEYVQEDYKSSHAELKSFTLMDNGSGLTMLNTESDTVSIVVGDKKEVSYSMKASENASVEINGKPMEMAGTIDISRLSEITVKVVSEDGRFSTEKTYLLIK